MNFYTNQCKTPVSVTSILSKIIVIILICSNYLFKLFW